MRLLLLVLLVTNSYASWYCKDVASEWMQRGKILSACGIGKGIDENAARLDAYNNARKEFNLICSKDTFCSTKVANIDRQRTECLPTENGFTCHRLFYYHITDQDRKPADAPPKEIIKEVVREKTNTIIQKTEVQEVTNQIHNTIYNSYIIQQPIITEMQVLTIL